MLTVVTPPTKRRLTTVEHVQALANVAGATPQSLELLIDQASAAIERYLGYPLGISVLKEEFVGRGAGLILSRGPVVEITGVTVSGGALAPADFVNDAGTIYRAPLSRWQDCSWAWNGAVVDYRAGYVLPEEPQPTLPSDIERAAILVVGAYFGGGSRDPNLRSETVEGIGSQTWATGSSAIAGALPSAEASAILKPYRQPVFA